MSKKAVRHPMLRSEEDGSRTDGQERGGKGTHVDCQAFVPINPLLLSKDGVDEGGIERSRHGFILGRMGTRWFRYSTKVSTKVHLGLKGSSQLNRYGVHS
jgi:hypothetical protein